MNFKDKPRFTQIMLGVADNFRDTISEEGMAMRFDMLKEYSMEEVEAAAKKILRSRKFKGMPPIVEFYEALEGSSKTKGLQAWGRIIEQLEYGQVLHPPHPKTRQPIDEKSIEAIKHIGGWAWLTRRTYDELQWDEKRFLEHYESCDDRHLPVLVEGKMAKLLDKIGGGI